MATDARKHTVPAATDAPKRADLTGLSLSIRDVIYVANATERNGLAAAIASAGGAAISATNPLYVHRGDAALDRRLEVSEDGSTWRAVTSIAPVSVTRTSDFVLNNPTAESGALFTINVPTVGPAYEIELYVPATYSTVSGDRAKYQLYLGAAGTGTPAGAGYVLCQGAATAAAIIKGRVPAGTSGSITATLVRAGGTGNITARFVEGGYIKLMPIDS